MINFNNSQNSLKGLFGKKPQHDLYNTESVEILTKISDDLKENHFENFKAYKKIIDYGLFDEEYYINQWDHELKIDPLLHYIYVGHLNNLNPCKKFDTAVYKDYNRNIKNDENPLVYFVNKGIYEGNIKINKEIWQPKAINRFEYDKKIENFDNYGLNTEEREIPLIISLTSYPKRIKEVKYAVYSLLNQEVKPDKLILWLSKQEFPNLLDDLPIDLLKLGKCGLTIKWTNSQKSYKKLIPTLKEYPDSIIVTADDDLYYSKNWLKKLYDHHLKYPNEIVSHRSRKISFNNNKIKKYLEWEISNNEEDASFLNFFTTGGGVLFPPKSLSSLIYDTNIYDNLCPTGDDIWFWAMAVENNTKIRVVTDNLHEIIYINPARDIVFNKDTLWSYNEKHNDEQLKNLLDNFPKIYEKIFNEFYSKN